MQQGQAAATDGDAIAPRNAQELSHEDRQQIHRGTLRPLGLLTGLITGSAVVTWLLRPPPIVPALRHGRYTDFKGSAVRLPS